MFSRAAALLVIATPLLAQEGAEAAKPNLLNPNTGLMVWTLAIFAVVFFVLSKYAFGPITAAVRAREQALEAAIAAAQADRDEAAKLLEHHRLQIEAARGEAQQLIADGRKTAESMKADMLESTKQAQDAMMERARRDIESEKTNAIAELRREAIDLALAGASRVIEQNLDNAQNRKLVESYLASIGTR
ncbi:MAG: F0F1 ATP synthase subunit B [Gemmatimonadetes bacterium]|nr:F0F1 ATP synthase subunit B [Gemmatimonadota bacterium]